MTSESHILSTVRVQYYIMTTGVNIFSNSHLEGRCCDNNY